ncbi:MAG: hypothetical protein IIX30_04510, partial [Clostridia bacterium]|nr:hypothetical protein [Clostridia bacterium]
MEHSRINELKQIAAKIRLGILEGTHAAASGHPGGSLSIADIVTYLYFEELNVDPKNPKWDDRDRFVLSKGHTAPALYGALAYKGFFSPDELKNLRNVNSFLQGHPDMKGTPGIDMSTGSLGLGFSAACGMALAGKHNKKDYRVYSIVGDGESQEGQIWEACMFASHYKLTHIHGKTVHGQLHASNLSRKTARLIFMNYISVPLPEKNQRKVLKSEMPAPITH